MKISKLEGIKLLSELNMPTVKLLDKRKFHRFKKYIYEGTSKKVRREFVRYFNPRI